MVGVYGDNWLRTASFSLMAIPLCPDANEEGASVVNVDEQLVAQRDMLKAFKVSGSVLGGQLLCVLPSEILGCLVACIAGRVSLIVDGWPIVIHEFATKYMRNFRRILVYRIRGYELLLIIAVVL